MPIEQQIGMWYFVGMCVFLAFPMLGLPEKTLGQIGGARLMLLSLAWPVLLPVLLLLIAAYNFLKYTEGKLDVSDKVIESIRTWAEQRSE